MPGNRRTVRLPDFNYAASAVYFITLCVENRDSVLGTVIDSHMDLSDFGQIVQEEWLRTPTIRPTVHLDDWQIMPEHFHAIIGIGIKPNEIGNERNIGNVGAHSCAPCHNGEDPSATIARRPQSLST